ncbi:MAG: transcriptional regulator [Sphingobacteriaceae bacterium]|nr:MAG: transcriptional regulator [Sphingobacteriaceae bacterium]
MKKRFLFILLVCCCYGITFGQSQIASPKVVNYSAEQYNSGIQNWAVAQDKNGILYFGNKEGLLTFNGKFWNKFSLPNYTGIKSVKVDSQNRIYVGGEDEFGYFFPNQQGSLKYHSLLHLIPEKERHMAHIWNMAIVNDEVFFRSLSSILHYKNGAVRVYKPREVAWVFLGSVNANVFAQGADHTIFQFDSGRWKPVIESSAAQGITITSVLAYSRDTVMLGTLKDGVFLLANGKLIKKHTAADYILQTDRVFSGTNISNNWFALGTASSGLIILDKKGNLLQRYSYPEGLQNDNIRAAFEDSNGALWLGLDDGIDMIAVNSAVKYIQPDRTKQVTFAIKVFNGKLYIGSSNGLYSTTIAGTQGDDLSLSKGTFEKLKNVHGQIWGLEEVNNQLFVSHEDGLAILQNGTPRYLNNAGSWMLQPVSNVAPTPQVLAGGYFSLELIDYKNGVFENSKRVAGISESLRFIVYDNAANIVWASHPYHGIYKLQLSPDLKRVTHQSLYTKNDGLPATLYNYVYRIHNRIVVATEKGIYEYNPSTNRFFYSDFFKPYFDHIPVIYLKEDNDENVWFVTRAKEVGVIELKEEKKGQVTYFPEIKDKIVGGFESIYPYNSSNIFIGSTKGVLHINYDKFKERKTNLKLLLGGVKITGETDSMIFDGYFVENGRVVNKQPENSVLSLGPDQNFLHFEFASTLYPEQSNIEYSCFLEGLDKKWSAWGRKSEKDYTGLPAGSYVFKVKARNANLESDVVTYRFVITPAWYRSPLSYVTYVLVLIFLIYRLFHRQRKMHKKEQEKLSYLNQLERDKADKEIIRLQNEKLETDLEFKNKELANMVMHLVQRGKVIEKIKSELAVVAKNNQESHNPRNFQRLLRLIAEVEKGEKDWEQFTNHFNVVHANFFKVLQAHYPDITVNELKLCAFIKMNLSTKEIAHLSNITIKAVEVARYRLRKKLSLQTDTNLYNFLVQIS